MILWLAFATFCALVFAAVKFSVDYVSTAEVDQGARVTASRGQVFFSPPGSSEKTLLGSRSELGVGTVVSLERTIASAELQLFDDSRVQLRGGSSLELTRMEVGRFINQHSLALTQSSGPIRYATIGAIDVAVPNGQVQLAGHGDYTVWIDDRDVTRVLVYGGEAHVSTATGAATAQAGRTLQIDSGGQVSVHDRQEPLLANADFGLHDQNWDPLDVPNSRLDVNGQRFWVPGPEVGGVAGTALRVVRDSVRGEHGETGLIQKIDRDVSGFRHLYIRAMVRVDYADLSGGGTLGSEYPMMIRVKYEGPVENSRPDWSVGFYYSNQDNRPVPEGLAVQWPQGEWKSYDVDLMNTEDSRVPSRLIEFAVMGQGHSYDARIANLSLIGD